MFRDILVAYDGSVGADAALDAAIALARIDDASLTILTVYRHHSMLEASLSMVRKEPTGSIDDAVKHAAREAAEQARQKALDAGLERVSAFIKPGHPARKLVSFALERDCGLIVVGSRGLGSAEGYLLGSVSHKVTGLAHCPVLVV